MTTSRSSQALPSFWIGICFLAPLMLLAGTEERTWTDQQGRKLDGSLSSIRSGAVEILLAKDRRSVTIPRQLLSPTDQRYIEIWEELGFGKELPRWPAELGPLLNFTPRVESIQGAKGWIYTTPNYHFHCDVELAASLVKEYSLAFEGTFHAIQKLPLRLDPKPLEDKFNVRLMGSREDYLRTGAPKGSAGVYLVHSREILVPMDSLGVRAVGNRVAVDPKSYDSGTLVHEITHQVMHDWLDVLPVWFVEGFAEYMAAVPCNQGRFYFRDIHQGILQRLIEKHHVQKNRAATVLVDLAPPEQIMSLTHQQWSAALSNEPNAALNYRSAMMLVYFFIHLDGSTNGTALATYLRQARAGQKEMESFVANYNGAAEDYNASLQAYNQAVQTYNQDLQRFRKTVSDYNSRVRKYNEQVEKGLPVNSLIEVGPEPSAPPSPPRKPEMPTILSTGNLDGGTVDLGEAEKRAREALTRMRSPVELWKQMAAALEQRGIIIQPANAISGASLAAYDNLRPASGRK